jgi:hypothetical protein
MVYCGRKIVNDQEDSERLHEQEIISLQDYREAHPVPDDMPPKPTGGDDPKALEIFWAGRNLAMRRSARWAA